MLIEFKNVNFNNMITYPDIEIEAEQVTFISGESGSGKSTLLKLINGVASPASGDITIEGKDILSWDTMDLRKKYLLAGQSVYLFDKTIRQNFEEFYRYRDLPAPADKEIQHYLSICCADFPLDSYCTHMSGGERQRVYIAICLSLKPEVLMLDEPTSALDSNTAGLLMQNLSSFCRNNHITLIVVSHDLTLPEQFADRVISLKGGD